MTHLVIGLTTTGHRKSKKKFASAAAKKKSQELAVEWNAKQKEWAKLSRPVKQTTVKSSFPTVKIPEGRDTTRHIKSLNTLPMGAVSSKPPPVYTGTNVIGIAQMAKSNAVPVFDFEHIKEIAHMRR